MGKEREKKEGSAWNLEGGVGSQNVRAVTATTIGTARQPNCYPVLQLLPAT